MWSLKAGCVNLIFGSLGLILTTLRYFILCKSSSLPARVVVQYLFCFVDRGGIHASRVLYGRSYSIFRLVEDLLTQNGHTGLLENVLFAHIRFHDTVSRGRLLNRFGKDFEGMFFPLSL